jgi:hypothetical protein
VVKSSTVGCVKGGRQKTVERWTVVVGAGRG